MLAEHGITIAPSTYYAHRARGFGPSAAELDEAYLANQLFDLWRATRGLYGRRKLWKAAQRAGLVVGRDQVERLMRICGITRARRGRRWVRTTQRDDNAPRSRDLICRDWSRPTTVNRVWVADVT